MTVLVVAGSALLACRVVDGPASATPGSPEAGSAVAASGDEAAIGGFVIELVGPLIEDGVETRPAFTSLIGRINDGATPAPVAWKVVAEGGGCRLLTPTVPFCDPGCGGGAACADDDRCVPYPRAVSLGRVHVHGLAGGALDLDEVAGNYLTRARIPFPPLPEGGKVELTTDGGTLGPLRLESVGIAPLELTSRVQPVAGQPLELAWRPPGQAGISTIEIAMDLSHHGGSRGKIECHAADTGALAIPSAQITALLSLGLSGFPTVVVTRVASGSTATRLGRATLRVVASVERAVEIEGLHSCRSDEHCPAGMTCQVDLKCK